MFDGQQLGEDIVGLVRGFMEREIAPLRAENAELKERLKALENRPAPEVIIPELPELPELPDFGDLIADAVSRAVEELPKPQDGKDAAGIVEALKDNGELVLTLQDGRLIRTGIRDGEKGQDGQDGFSLDDFDCVPVDERTLELQFTQGDRKETYELVFPVVIDRGVYKEGGSYARGDGVTWGGSFWIAQKDNPEGKPDSPDGGWRLAVKRGRDGKDAKVG